MAVKTALKYLFEVIYKDGTKFEQTPEDVSSVDSQRSAYYDVKQDEIKAFYLRDAEEGWYVAQVDLDSGKIFMNDGIGFTFSKPGPGPYKLSFWRQHTHIFNLGSTEELSHEIKYILGYSDASGKEHTITID